MSVKDLNLDLISTSRYILIIINVYTFIINKIYLNKILYLVTNYKLIKLNNLLKQFKNKIEM